MLYFDTISSLDSKKLYVQAAQQRGEVVRYDLASKQFVPILENISASDLAFSRDGKWITYVSIPEGNLWRSRIDGSERLQLTDSSVIASLPTWSPDGSQIAYIGSQNGGPWKIFLASMTGGPSEEVLPKDDPEVDVTWSADGQRLAFGRISTSQGTNDILVADLKNRQVSSLPESKGLFSPRWSPDGRYLSAVTIDSKRVMLYDFQTQKWSEWFKSEGNINYGGWSSDGRYFYYDTFAAQNPASFRVRFGQHEPQNLYSLRGLRRYLGPWGSWSGQSPDDSRLYVRDAATPDIYALDVDFP
ncbi:MAG TPA: hypothetical protein VLK33_00035 [Terriglobales bacterium]|nr:hypothetical protein [Terriglobales bacterium]